ncbi:hypothetical protein SERLA73DRAFT_188047 [Serpula lacrymans var. lacrymans S7.3]|uniref:Uncharacterized protein n=2 Tax=Serpula lacrymans var. lacrymans TaxID=341189 RepID=F8QBP9_SERL3|nr:uncharacterized protein SERLADRAFT_478006 [Serpula lacrymans var. lacrymans S7.9]EGN94260.1 hypothetical protein SERLA73DRAFT_188047 [Serpula lacrymans var. lacrymans S7.3]EGO19752.1 hypothetical protein SERLADRAFT_478006 [Serpula lacrymans var. lacrymans S7.9]
MNLPKADEHMSMTLRRGKKTINGNGSLNLSLKTRVVPARRDAQASSRVDSSRQAQLVGLGLRQTRSIMAPHSPLAPSSIPRLVSGPPSPASSAFSVRQSQGQGPPPVPTSPLVNTFSRQFTPGPVPSVSRRRLTVTASEPRRVGSGYSSDTIGTWAGAGAFTSAGSDRDHVGAADGGNVRTRGLARRPSLAVLPSPRTPGKTDGNAGTGREKLTRRPSLAVLMSPKTPGKGDGNTGTVREIMRRPSLAVLSSPRTPGRGGNGSDGINSASLRELSRRPSLGVLLSSRVPGRNVGDDGGSGAGALGNTWR